MIKEFTININEDQITNIKSKIEHYPWSSIESTEGWTHGTSKKYLKELCNYWVKEFNWKKHEQLINNFKNYKTNVDGVDIHFIKEEGSGEKPKPGNDGAMTVNASLIFPPNTSGCANGLMISKNSTTDPGHPCNSNKVFGFSPLPSSLIK